MIEDSVRKYIQGIIPMSQAHAIVLKKVPAGLSQLTYKIDGRTILVGGSSPEISGAEQDIEALLSHAREACSCRRISMGNGRSGFLLISSDRDVLAQGSIYCHEGMVEVDIQAMLQSVSHAAVVLN